MITDNHVDDSSDDGDAPALNDRDQQLDALCENWVAWCRERRLYWSAPSLSAEIVRRGGGNRPLRPRTSRGATQPTMAALHIAYTCQPDSLDKQVFDLYYVARVKPIKAAASALGIGRAHFYRVLVEFRRRVGSAARAFEENGADAGRLLNASHTEAPAVNNESVSQAGDKTGPPT